MSNWKKIKSDKSAPAKQKKIVDVVFNPIKKENIIFVGAEESYKTFWTKLMFISAAFAFINKKSLFRAADKYTLAYVDEGYKHSEKLPFEYLKNENNFHLLPIKSPLDIINYLNDGRDCIKVQDMAFFSHGLHSKIILDYAGGYSGKIMFDSDLIEKINVNVFRGNGRVFSYACRTGVSVDDNRRGFEKESDAKPDDSLAQKMADRFDIEVHAYLRRTNYENVIRIGSSPEEKKTESERIAAILKSELETKKEGQIIQIPPHHEALPHEGQGNGSSGIFGFGAWGSEKEGTSGYSLWRKGGGRVLPNAAETPIGLPAEMRIFKKRK